ncbi:hypothetical protein [Streptomyces sp. NPDC058371]|jgi:hypothetical protein|uniref:hypothetical protein n=1 Tax=Streptomyces sp. NPDC058371 TaxID=3346463 RepID=UPI003665796B
MREREGQEWGRAARSAPAAAVDPIAEQVGVAGVVGIAGVAVVLLDHVEEHPAQ